MNKLFIKLYIHIFSLSYLEFVAVSVDTVTCCPHFLHENENGGLPRVTRPLFSHTPSDVRRTHGQFVANS